MYDDEIEKVNKWFEDEERAYDTGFDGEYYSVSELEIDDFCDFLRELNPDIIGILCMVGKNGIWFTKKDLNNARRL